MSDFNWRSIEVLRDRDHENLVQRIMSQSMLPYIKDLMVFAALVGYSDGKRKPLGSDTIKITLDTYATDDLDGFIYLLALIEQKDAACLKDENLRASVQIFEEYCNAGLHIIRSWLDSNATDLTGVDTILFKIYEKVQMNNDRGEISNDDVLIDLA